MVVFLAIIIIIILIYLDKDDNQKEKDLDNQIVGYNTMNGRPILRKYVNITGYDTRTGQPIFEYKKPIIGYNSFTGEPIFEGNEVPKETLPKQPLTEEDKNRISNSILIITGAVLVVIASIIFLATGWETMHGLLKTLILFCIQMIFSLFAYISHEKLNIPKIGKMFNYLTLAFVPIIILSLSFFELIGDYFSVGGDGFTYFVGISLLISDFVYKLYGKAKKDIFSKQSSLILEALAILYIVSNFELMYIEVFALIIHTIIIYLLLQGGYLDQEAYGELNKVYSILLIPAAAIPTLSEVTIMSFTNLILLALNFFVKCLNSKEDTSKKGPLVCFFISYLLAIRIIEQIEISPYFLYLLSLLPILGLTKVVSTTTMKNNIIKVVGILTVAITAFSILDPTQSIYYLLTFIIGFFLSLLVYSINKKSFYKLWSYISFSAIFFCICYITEIQGVDEYILLVMPILIYAIEIIYEKLKDDTSPLFIIGTLIIEVLYLTTEYTMILPLLLMAVYCLLERKKDALLIPMFLSLLMFSLESKAVVSIIFGLLTVTYIFGSIGKEGFNRYTVFSAITLVLLCLYLEVSAYITWGLLLIWGIIHYICKPRDNNEIYLSVMIFSIFGLYTKALIDIESELYANYALGIILVAIAMTRGVLKKWDETLLSFMEWCVIIGLTLLGSIVIQEAIDGVAYLGILLVLSILSYTKEWKNYLYSSIISMVFGVIVLTAEYWKEIPWYVYILVIGLALIIFAMYDEKRKQLKKSQINQVQPILEQPVIQTPQVVETPPVLEQPIVIPTVEEQYSVVEEPTPKVVETAVVVETPPVVEQPQIEEEKTVVEEPKQETGIKLQIVDDTSTTKVEDSSKKTGARKSNKTKSINKNQKAYNKQ